VKPIELKKTKFTEKEIQEMKNLYEKMDSLIKGGTIGSPRHPFN